MSVQAIVEKITHEAQEQAASLLTEAEQKRTEIEAQTEKQLATLQQHAVVALEKEKAHIASVTKSLAEQQKKIAVQKVKRAEVNAVFDKALTQLRDMSADSYATFFTQVCREQVVVDAEEITSVRTAPQRTAETAQILEALGITVTCVADESLTGGLVLEGDMFSFDCSLERLFAERRPQLEIEVAQILFGTPAA